MKKSLLTTLILTGTLPALAQNPGGGGFPGSPAAGGGGGNTTINRTQTEHKSPHGEEIPIVDPTNKTFEFQGRKYSLMDNNIGGQFEAFLTTDTLNLKNATEYRETIKQILQHLAPNRKTKPDLNAAFKLLSKASEYPGDGNICNSLVTSLQGARNTRIKVHRLVKENANLQKEKKRIINNMRVIAEKFQFTEPGKKGQPKKSPRQNIEYQMLQKRLVEIELRQKKNEAGGLIDFTQAKIQYQAMMIQLFVQRRFEHVIMSARFYNLVFEDGDSKMRIKKGSDTDKFFSEGVGVSPTVAGMDSAANEAILKVRTLVSAYKNDIEAKRLHSASERLVEAFAIGEYMPDVQTLLSEPKLRVKQYVLDANDMVKTLGAKDLEKAEKLNERLSAQATDYNESEAKSYINGLKTVSNNYCRDATMALLQIKLAKTTQERYNEEQRFKTAMTGAVKAWPSNPEIKDLDLKIKKIIIDTGEGMDQLSIARKQFDNWKKMQAWSAIFDEKERLGGAFGLSQANQDKVRLDELRKIIADKGSIFGALKEAKTLSDRGFPEEAWEVINRMRVDNKNDIDLSNAEATYSSSAAKFAVVITKAKELEAEEPASFQALNWYLKAQHINPNSNYAKEGIARILSRQEGGQ